MDDLHDPYAALWDEWAAMEATLKAEGLGPPDHRRPFRGVMGAVRRYEAEVDGRVCRLTPFPGAEPWSQWFSDTPVKLGQRVRVVIPAAGFEGDMVVTVVSVVPGGFEVLAGPAGSKAGR